MNSITNFHLVTTDGNRFRLMLRGPDMHRKLCDLDNFLQNKIKNETYPEEIKKLLIKIRQMLPNLEK